MKKEKCSGKCCEKKDMPPMEEIADAIRSYLKRRSDILGECYKALKTLADYFAMEHGAMKDGVSMLGKLEEKIPAKEDNSKKLITMLMQKSKYDFSKAEYAFVRNKNADTKNTVAFDVVIYGETEEEGPDGAKVVKAVAQKSIFHTYSSFEKSVKALDATIDAMFCRPPLKKACKCKGKCNGKCKGKCKADRKKPLRMNKACGILPPTIESLKRELLAQSQYKVPYHRLRIVADKVDRKSRKWVYELRFFQRDCTHHKDQPYEPVPFRIRMGKVVDAKLAGKRFDKAIESLKFNTFDKKSDR